MSNQNTTPHREQLAAMAMAAIISNNDYQIPFCDDDMAVDSEGRWSRRENGTYVQIDQWDADGNGRYTLVSRWEQRLSREAYKIADAMMEAGK